jgi:hypothetical protein
MPSNKISYSRGFPYGAPLVTLRGGALKRDEVKAWVRLQGFQWNSAAHGYQHYMYGDDLRDILEHLRDHFNCEIVAKSGMDANYILDLTGSED